MCGTFGLIKLARFQRFVESNQTLWRRGQLGLSCLGFPNWEFAFKIFQIFKFFIESYNAEEKELDEGANESSHHQHIEQFIEHV